MSNYAEKTVEGEVTSWLRASHIVLKNNVPPEANCFEVQKTILPNGEVIERQTCQLDYVLTDPSDEIVMVDPETFAPTEVTFTAGEFYAMAASLYFHLARQRDGEL